VPPLAAASGGRRPAVANGCHEEIARRDDTVEAALRFAHGGLVPLTATVAAGGRVVVAATGGQGAEWEAAAPTTASLF
jgi:hypothetical protein